MTAREGKSKLHTTAWALMLLIGILMLGTGLFIFTQPVSADDFESATGITWEDHQASNPEAAAYLEREAQLLGVAFASLGLVASALAATLLRRGNRTAWAVAWFVPVAFAGSAAVFLGSNAGQLGGFYAGAAVVAAAIVVTGQMTARG